MILYRMVFFFQKEYPSTTMRVGVMSVLCLGDTHSTRSGAVGSVWVEGYEDSEGKGNGLDLNTSLFM